MPMLALTFASATSVVLVLARILWTGRFGYSFLVWNLFLAWLPMIFALLACEKYQPASGRTGASWVWPARGCCSSPMRPTSSPT